MDRLYIREDALLGRVVSWSDTVYGPEVTAAMTMKRFVAGEFEALFYSDIIPGHIDYRFIVVVYRIGEDEPVMFVTSEAGDEPEKDDVCFLCAFEDGAHLNYGRSARWADEEEFIEKALGMISERVGTGDEWEAVPDEE